MPGMVRVGDICSGHFLHLPKSPTAWVTIFPTCVPGPGTPCPGFFPPRPVITGSPNVTINGIPAARQGDMLAIHFCTADCTHFHDGSILIGSPNVTINGIPAARVGDLVDCNSVLAIGSSNVTSN